MSETHEVEKYIGPIPGKPKTLTAKLCEVMAAVGYLQKKGSNEKQEYKYIREADVVAKMRDEFAKRNVFIFPTLLSHDRVKLSRVKYDKLEESYVTDIVMRWTFVDGDSGEERTCDIPGCSASPGDKGVYVAMTGSEKYLLMKSFLLPTGDDPEDDKNEESGSKEAAQAIGAQKLKDLEAAKRAKQQGNGADLTKTLQDSIAAVQTAKPAGNGHSKPELLQAAVEVAKDDGLFEEVSGTIQAIRFMQTSPAKGSRPYRKITMTTIIGGNLTDIEISAFQNFEMSDVKCFEALDAPETIGSTARFVIERSGKFINLKDIKQIGFRDWEYRNAVIHTEDR